MKKIHLLIVIVITLLITSCEIKEEITINKDGSGEVFYNYDMSQLLKEMPVRKKDSVQKKIDTIIDFNQLLNNPKFKDSIAKLSPEKKEMLASLKNMKMRMVMDDANKKMEFGFGFSFKNIDSLKNMFEKIQKAQEFSSKKKQTEIIKDKPVFKGLSGTNQDLSYNYDGKWFVRTVKLKQPLTKEDEKKMDSDLNQNGKIDQIFNSLKYTIILHFPKKIKKVNVKNAIFSDHRKTVTITYGLDQYLKHPESLNLKIKLAKK